MIIVTGSIAYDFIIDFPGKFAEHILPEEIHKINLSFSVNHYAKRRGGTAANATYTMQLLNTPSTLFSIVGKDFGEYQEFYKKLGIDTSKIIIDEDGYTSTGFAITDKSNNQIWGYSYGVASRVSDLKLKTVAKKGDLVLVGPNGVAGIMNFVKQSIDLGLEYIFDPSFTLTEMSNEDLELGISHASYVFGNDYEMTLIKNRLNNWQDLFRNKTIITTLGEKGAAIESEGKTYSIASVKPKEIVDPTGAGDAWRGGFLTGLAKKYDLQICGQLGSTAASFALEKYGTQEHEYTLEEFVNRYRQAYGSLVEL